MSMIIGFGAGLLAHAGGANTSEAVLTGGSAFGASLLLLAFWHFVVGPRA